jgi:hypothetical protein
MNISGNDCITQDILGVTNPKLSMIPGAIENDSLLNRDVTILQPYSGLANEIPLSAKGTLASQSSSGSCSTYQHSYTPPTKRHKQDESLEDLHRSVLQLQRQKLILKIKCMQENSVVKRDASTQTPIQSNIGFVQMLYDDVSPY